ncbi:MAG: hypothetical protein Q9218_007650, partial [Villophora microphyllina]
MAVKRLLYILFLAFAVRIYARPNTAGTPVLKEHILTKKDSTTFSGVTYKSDSYTLAFAQQNQTKAVQIFGLLSSLRLALSPVSHDLVAMTPFGPPDTSEAYSTFFKDTRNRLSIRDLLQKISRGDPVYAPTFPPHQWQNMSPLGGPVIMSITEHGQFLSDPDGPMADVLDWCHANPYVTGVVPFSLVTPAPYILLCPFFFEAQPPNIYGDVPPRSSGEGQPASNCLNVNSRTNVFRKTTPRLQPAGFELTQYRMWILFELLARLYRSADVKKIGPDVADVNGCLKLKAKDAIDNGPT